MFVLAWDNNRIPFEIGSRFALETATWLNLRSILIFHSDVSKKSLASISKFRLHFSEAPQGLIRSQIEDTNEFEQTENAGDKLFDMGNLRFIIDFKFLRETEKMCHPRVKFPNKYVHQARVKILVKNVEFILQRTRCLPTRLTEISTSKLTLFSTDLTNKTENHNPLVASIVKT